MFIRCLSGFLVFTFVSPSLAQTPGLMRGFNLQDRGSISFAAAGGENLASGYTRIQVISGSTLPVGMAILSNRQNGVLISEESVPAMPLMLSGRSYVEIGPSTRTGVAIANPNAQPVTVSFYFTDTSGNRTAQGSTIIGANSQLAAFLDQSPFNSATSRGTFTFTASALVSAIAFETDLNERNEPLMTTLPVIDLSAPPSGMQTVAHFVWAGDWLTNLILVNPTESSMSGTLKANAPTGETLGLAPASYTIPARSSAIISPSVVADPRVGSFDSRAWLSVIPAGAAAPSVTALFVNHVPAGLFRSSQTFTMAAVPATAARTAFRLFVQNKDPFASIGSTQAGIAIANPNALMTSVALELFAEDGTSTGLKDFISIPPNGQAALFINQVPGLSGLPSDFKGILSLRSPVPVSVIGLFGTFNERSDFVITPTFPIGETDIQQSSELLFPYFVSGRGFTTEFVLFSNRAVSIGTVYFFDQNGGVPNLTFNQD